MGLVELDLDLGDEERAILDAVRKFATEVMRPIGVQLDRMAAPADAIAKASPLWEAYRRYRELGLEEVRDPAGPLEAARRARLGAMISEELGWGDSGLAISFGVAGFQRTNLRKTSLSKLVIQS